MSAECARCGRCCQQDIAKYPWYDVGLTQADEFRISPALFEHRRGGSDKALAFWMSRASNGACIAYRDGVGCLIHEIKPQECRDYQPEGEHCVALRGKS